MVDIKREVIIMPARSHGDTGTRLHRIWQNMKARCYGKYSREYENYGGRGIVVCDEWRNSYEKFKEWAISNGYDENLTIDRINTDGNYEPSNCRWITNKEQQNNKRDNVCYEFNGEIKTLAQWSEELGICYKTLQKRIRNWGVERAFTEPLKTENVIDITGKKFGRLTVISRAENKSKGRAAYFRCVCDCGNEKVVQGQDLRKGTIRSCGCLQKEGASKRYKDVVKARVDKADNKIVRCYTKDGEFIKEYRGVKSAAKDVEISRNMIWRALRGESHTAKGMIWRCEDC